MRVPCKINHSSISRIGEFPPLVTTSVDSDVECEGSVSCVRIENNTRISMDRPSFLFESVMSLELAVSSSSHLSGEDVISIQRNSIDGLK